MIKASGSSLKTDPQTDVERQKRRLKDACQDFEAVMTNYLFKAMQSNVVRAEEPDQATEIFEGMMGETLAKESSRHDNLGMGDILYRQLVSMIPENSGETGSSLKKSTDSSDI
jgi:Rod binding domain-containing protein